MIVLPSRGRPTLLQRYFDEGQPEQPGVVVIDTDQMHLYSELRYPAHWSVFSASPRCGFVRAMNEAFARYPNEPWYAFGGDDVIGRTPHWDTLLAAAVTPSTVVWPNDGIRGACTLPVIGGDLVRALGWLCHPDLTHIYCDTLWGDIARVLNIGTYRSDILVEHLHFSNGKAEYDQTYRERQLNRDRAAYQRISLSALLSRIADASRHRP